MKIWSWCVSTKSVNMLIGPMADSDSWPVCAHIRLGPNTTARLDEVILFKSLRSITYRTTETHIHTIWASESSSSIAENSRLLASDSVSLGQWYPAFKRHYSLSKWWEPPAHWHCVTSHKTWREKDTSSYISNTPVAGEFHLNQEQWHAVCGNGNTNHVQYNVSKYHKF